MASKPLPLLPGHADGHASTAQRRRRAHKKSRLGCASCKLRSVKCDETRPCCSECKRFAIRCIYGTKVRPESLYAGSFVVELAPTPVRSLPAPLPVIPAVQSADVYELVPDDVQLIEKFQRRSVLTLGSAATSQEYLDRTLPLAFSNVLVMHTILAYAKLHDMSFDTHYAALPSRLGHFHFHYHWHRSLTLLQQKLSQPLVSSEQDALWIAAALINLASFASIEAKTPSESWPLREPSALDLAWLKMCGGKKTVLQMTQPMRQDGPYRDSARELCIAARLVFRMARRPLDRTVLPDDFYELFELGRGPHLNPYYAPVVALSGLLATELDGKNFLPHVSFAWLLDESLRDLLCEKDDRALLVLLYWYAKTCDRRIWWLYRHACIEGQAVCQYLERVWATRPDRSDLLRWPRMKLAVASGEYEA